ncbi:MAG: serine acetyltransferase [Bacteroidales bacterium]|nr:serine acetyltransferase [Bacteroidales bacterium]
MEIRELTFNPIVGFIYLLESYPSFRSLFYMRIGNLKYLLKWFCIPQRNLVIATKNIGERFYIHLGFSTAIGAKSIGKNCIIYQQVSIGSYHGFPTILDNVTIYPGAIIIGNITVGNNVKIGANATVFSDVPDNTTVYPPKSTMMRWGKNKPETDYLKHDI